MQRMPIIAQMAPTILPPNKNVKISSSDKNYLAKLVPHRRTRPLSWLSKPTKFLLGYFLADDRLFQTYLGPYNKQKTQR